MTPIQAHPYFRSKTEEHDVTLNVIYRQPIKALKTPLVRVCETDEARGMQSLLAISPIVFWAMGRKKDKQGIHPPTQILATYRCRTLVNIKTLAKKD